MTYLQYLEKRDEARFEELPLSISGNEVKLQSFVKYEEAELKLKIHLAKVLLNRTFLGSTDFFLTADHDWFIDQFLKYYDNDKLKPEITNLIKKSIELILNDHFCGVIGTTFMFGIIEFYAKYKLGFRPIEYDFFDDNKRNYIKKHFPSEKNIRDISIAKALKRLQGMQFGISIDLVEIDSNNKERNKRRDIPEKRWFKLAIADQVSFARNTMLHGELHSFYGAGKFLIILYILFHLNELQESGCS